MRRATTSWHMHDLASGARRIARRLWTDRSGGTAVQALVFMPVMIITFYLLITVWKVVQVRDTLHHATHQATRYLSLYPAEPYDQFQWEEIAKKIVAQELTSNPMIVNDSNRLLQSDYNVEIQMTDELDCKAKFTLEAKYRMFNIPWGQVTRFGVPGPRELWLVDEREGEVLCQ